MEAIHPNAFKAAEAAHCAAEQGKYWEMHARLFAHQQALGLSDLPRHAQALGLDMATFQVCVESGKYATTIRQGLADGQRAGVNGTPTIFLGLMEPNNPKVKVVGMLVGAQPYSSFREAIDRLLSLP